MNDDLLRQKAKAEAEDFLKNDTEYRMGYVDSEKPHPHTRYLSQTYQNSTENGVRMLFEVDFQMAERAKEFFNSEEYVSFSDSIRKTLRNGGRVIFSGCGSSGRLSMRLEQSWRGAINKLIAKYPHLKSKLEKKITSVGNIMTGGDYAVIRAVESFEDSTLLGKAQAKELCLASSDLLVGVTATGETTSILGTCAQALEDGASVYMLICSDPKPVIENMDRARKVYLNSHCSVISLPCGSMALTGSTRMQSSTFEQFAAAVALEAALYDILEDEGVKLNFHGYSFYGNAFVEMTKMLLSQKSISLVAKATETEQKIYENGGLITLFADEFLLDVLTDTTERSPTFMTPPFCSLDMPEQPQSWAFVKNPNFTTNDAWVQCFLREPNCIEWKIKEYEKLGLTKNQIEKIPDISRPALKRFMIGNEPDPKREMAPCSHALWIDAHHFSDEFAKLSKRYSSSDELTLDQLGLSLPETMMDLYEHLAIKLVLNTLSTGTMARIGRISGNWMTCLAMSNKKLVDRSARIVSDLCKVPYETALEEIFYAKLKSEAEGTLLSPAQEAIRSLGIK